MTRFHPSEPFRSGAAESSNGSTDHATAPGTDQVVRREQLEITPGTPHDDVIGIGAPATGTSLTGMLGKLLPATW